MINKIVIQVERFSIIPNTLEVRSSIEVDGEKVESKKLLDIALLDYESYFDMLWRQIGDELKRYLTGDVK